MPDEARLGPALPHCRSRRGSYVVGEGRGAPSLGSAFGVDLLFLSDREAVIVAQSSALRSRAPVILAIVLDYTDYLQNVGNCSR